MKDTFSEEYKKKIKLLDKYKKHYYQNQKPKVTDK